MKKKLITIFITFTITSLLWFLVLCFWYYPRERKLIQELEQLYEKTWEMERELRYNHFSESVNNAPSDINMEKTYTVNVFDTTDHWFSTGLIIETNNKAYLDIDIYDRKYRLELKSSDKENYKYMTTEKQKIGDYYYRGACLYVK